jgi:hypothetical protein
LRAQEVKLISLRGSQINAGTLGQPPGDDNDVIYDLTDATLGNVLIGSKNGDRAFEHIRINNTSFDGFDFSNHRNELTACDWNIHTPAESGDKNTNRYNSDLETTYLKAKNGANEVGDSRAASEFFQKEMFYNRRQKGEHALDSNENGLTRVRAAGLWIANWFLGLISGYGEKPWRVIGTSVFVVAIFAVGFTIWPNSESNLSYSNLVENLTLSIGSFVSLVLNGGTLLNTDTRSIGSLVGLTAGIEAFIGAFLIALFVFTLTRSMRR